VRPALKASWQRRKTFAGTGMMAAVLTVLGYGLCLAPGLVFSVIWALVAPVVMMENLRGRAALKRSKILVMRSLRTTIAAVFIMFFVPVIFSMMIAFFANAAADTFQSDADKITAAQKRIEKQNRKKAAKDALAVEKPVEDNEVNVLVNGAKVDLNDEPQSMGAKIRETVREALTQILLLPFQIIIGSFSSIIFALLYLKTRQAGGESMQDLLAQFEQTDQPRTNWQKRVQARLEQSGKLTSKT
ncbi:MAG: hypothetical protein LH614_19295, partial [Pyrinomonadaceae bacterium]|nr:hypothetical protein [Pyrinomonadaceae bacterium]